jgi:hypothetical protein
VIVARDGSIANDGLIGLAISSTSRRTVPSRRGKPYLLTSLGGEETLVDGRMGEDVARLLMKNIPSREVIYDGEKS